MTSLRKAAACAAAISFCLYANLTQAQTDSLAGFLPVKRNYRYGAIDRQGRTIIAPRFTYMGDFDRYGRATVVKGGLVGMIDSLGNALFEPKYSAMRTLSADRIAVAQGGRWGVMDGQARLLVPCRYTNVSLALNGYIEVVDGQKRGLHDPDGKLLAQPLYEAVSLLRGADSWIVVRKDGRRALVDAAGRTLAEGFTQIRRPDQNGLVFFSVIKGQTEYWGALNDLGEQTLSPQWQTVQYLNPTLIVLEKAPGLAALYNVEQQSLVTPPRFNRFAPYGQELVVGFAKGEMTLMRDDGAVVAQNGFEDIRSLGQGCAAVLFQKLWRIVKLDGTILNRDGFSYIYDFPADVPITLVEFKGKKGLINADGQLLARPEYDQIEVYDRWARAFKGRSVSMIEFDERGTATSSRRFDNVSRIRLTNRLEDRREYRRRDPLAPQRDTASVTRRQPYWQAVRTEEGIRWGLYFSQDSTIIEPIFRTVQNDPERGYAKAAIPVTDFLYNYYLINNRTGKAFFRVIECNNLHELDFDSANVARVLFRYPPSNQGGPFAVKAVRKDGQMIGMMPLKRKGRPTVYRSLSYVGAFSEGLARVNVGGKMDYGSSLPERRRFNLDMPEEFAGSATSRCTGGKWGYIDPNGKLVIQAAFDFAEDFNNGSAIVMRAGKWGAIDPNGNLIVPLQYDDVTELPGAGGNYYLLHRYDRREGFLDTLGHAIGGTGYQQVGTLRQGLLPAKKNGLWGYVNPDGQWLVEPRFSKANDFSEGLAAVMTPERRWGFIDRNGRFLIEPTYKRATSFGDGLAWVRPDTSRYVCIRPDQTLAFQGRYGTVRAFRFGVARVKHKGKWGLLGADGRWKARPKYWRMYHFSEDGYAEIRRNRRGLLDTLGKEVLPLRYRNVEPLSDGTFRVGKRKFFGLARRKWAYFDRTGKRLTRFRFDWAEDFSEGLAWVKDRSRKKTFVAIDANGEVRLDSGYYDPTPFRHGRSLVRTKRRGAPVVIDTLGKRVASDFAYVGNYRDGAARVTVGGRYNYVTEAGALLSDRSFAKATDFENGIAFVADDTGYWAMLDTDGRLLTAFRFLQPGERRASEDETAFKVATGRHYGIAQVGTGRIVVEADFEVVDYLGEGLFKLQGDDWLGYLRATGSWLWPLSR